MGRVQLRTPKCSHSPSAGVELSVNNHAADFTLSTSSGTPISLSCLVQNSSKAEELLWYRGDGQVDLKDGNKVNISNICISPATETDNGVTFTCKLRRDQSVKVSVILDVQCESLLWISVWNGLVRQNHGLSTLGSGCELKAGCFAPLYAVFTRKKCV